jgi:hypothetical protein
VLKYQEAIRTIGILLNNIDLTPTDQDAWDYIRNELKRLAVIYRSLTPHKLYCQKLTIGRNFQDIVTWMNENHPHAELVAVSETEIIYKE